MKINIKKEHKKEVNIQKKKKKKKMNLIKQYYKNKNKNTIYIRFNPYG